MSGSNGILGKVCYKCFENLLSFLHSLDVFGAVFIVLINKREEPHGPSLSYISN